MANNLIWSNIYSRESPGMKHYTCVPYGNSFISKSQIEEHMNTHTGKTRFICEICQKQFSNKRNLNRHRNNHTGEKPFPCEMCQKAFSEKCSLKSHMRMHTGEKPFKCEICSKAFTRKSTLNTHMRVHIKKPLISEIWKEEQKTDYFMYFPSYPPLVTYTWLQNWSKYVRSLNYYSCPILRKKTFII